MNSIKELKELILFSLDISPSTEKELLQRDFLRFRSSYGISILIRDLENNKKIYRRKNDKLYAYKDAINELKSHY